MAALVASDGSVRQVLPVGQAAREVSELDAALESSSTRWVCWSAREAARPLVERGVRPARSWDVAEAHRVLFGGFRADPGWAWAAAHGLPVESVPAAPTGDLFDLLGDLDEAGPPVRADGQLRPDAVAGSWQPSAEQLLAWAGAALKCADRQRLLAQRLGPRVVATIAAESAAALLCEELHFDGLPVDRARLLELVTPLCGPRAQRDAKVLRLVPGREGTDLRNPAQVRDLLAAVGIDAPNTRKQVLEAFRQVHPVVPALLTWRKEERIATTYGLRWIEEHIGTDDRLRGNWTACDGAAGRMTADAGLHNLPAVLRSAVAAEPGFAFVQADLGQVEPRVLAVVSGDPAFAAAATEDDLYAPVAARLAVERPVAKVAMLAAMYGQRSGAAGQALRGLERAYPVAMGFLDDAYAAGVRGEDLRTYGGRLIPTGRLVRPEREAGGPSGQNPMFDPGLDPGLDPTAGPRGRFARNAVIQGAAAELFKAWAATVRATIAPLGARVVLCLHDELLVHTPLDRAEEVAAAVNQALADASRRWSRGAPVRFVTDTAIIRRWSDAKA